MDREDIVTVQDAKDAFAGFPATVVALAATVDGAPVAMVVSSFSVGVSFDPPKVMFAVQNSSDTWQKLRRSRILGMTLLGEGQEGAALQLSSRHRDRFFGLSLLFGDEDALHIAGGAQYLEGRVQTETTTGDHLLVIVEITKIHRTSIAPLIYEDRRFLTTSNLLSA